MKKLKHSKYRNTGILFELLSRQLTKDTLSNELNSPAIGIIKEFFGKNTAIKKELDLYRALDSSQKLKDGTQAYKLVEAVTSMRAKLSETTLARQKYNLIKAIKKHYLLEEFFSFKVSNYRVLASAYKLFEHKASDNPVEYVNAQSTIKEHLSRKPLLKEEIKNPVLENYNKESRDTQKLAYLMSVDKFNEKYKGLSEGQKSLLHQYIYNQDNSTGLRDFMLKESSVMKKKLKKLVSRVDVQSPTKLKLDEVLITLDRYSNVKKFNDSHVTAMMRFYDLEAELGKLEA